MLKICFQDNGHIDCSIDDLISYLPPGEVSTKETLKSKLTIKKPTSPTTTTTAATAAEGFNLDETSNDSLLGLLNGSSNQNDKNEENKWYDFFLSTY